MGVKVRYLHSKALDFRQVHVLAPKPEPAPKPKTKDNKPTDA